MNIIKFLLITVFLNALSKNILSDEDIFKYKNDIGKSYKNLNVSNESLLKNFTYYCSTDRKNIKDVKNSFLLLLESWTNVQHIRFGPVNDFNHYSRIQFWPDKRNVTNRQFLKAKKNMPNDLYDYQLLSNKSVALQGIPILERIVYNELNSNNYANNKKQAFFVALLPKVVFLSVFKHKQ